MKNKVFLITFILLILYSSSVFATDIDSTHLTIDSSVVGWSLGVIDASEKLADVHGGSADDYLNYDSCLLRISSNGRLYCYFSNGKFYYNTNDSTIYNSAGFDGFTLLSNGSIGGSLGGGSNYPVTDEFTSSAKVTCNYIFSDNTFSSLFVRNNVDSNNTSFFNNAFNYSSGGGDSGGGDSGGGDSGGGDSGSQYNYTDVLNHIDSQVTSTNTIILGIDTSVVEMQNTINDIYNSTDNIDNSVSDIKDYLIGSNNEISNTIMSTSETTQNMIASQTQQQQNNFNIITNTTTYNSSDAVIDTSFNTIQDVNGVDNFIVRIYNIIYAFFDDLDTSLVVNITIPVPFTNKSFVLSTSSIQNFYSQHTALSNLISISWYFVFGIYIFRLAYKFWISSVTGSVFRDTEGFTADLDADNLVKSLFL